jgi:tetratricopeptide (TPR) repeat protein
MRKALLLSLLLPIVLTAASARATDPDTELQAKQRFASGAQAYREARYRDAIDLFLQANKLDPHPELIFNVGQAYEKLGDVPSALRSYREYLRLSPGATDRATVEASIRNLETRLRDKGVQQVSVFSTPVGATLLIDQQRVGPTPWTGEISPGRHLATLQAQGYPDTAKEFVLAPDRAMDLDIAMSTTLPGANQVGAATAVAPAPTATPAQQPQATPPPDTPRHAHVAPWTIAALSVGAAGLVASLGFEIARERAQSAAQSDLTQIGYSNDLSTMNERATAARVLVGVGSVVTAAGAVLLIVDLRSGSAPPAKAGLGCHDGVCGAFAVGRF